MNRNMQPEIHPSATTYSVQNSISDTLIPIAARRQKGCIAGFEAKDDYLLTNPAIRNAKATLRSFRKKFHRPPSAGSSGAIITTNGDNAGS
jgi:hypothetical protein